MGKRSRIYNDLLIAKEQGYLGIDITDGITFTNEIHSDYGFVMFDDMVIYDKYGDNIDKYQLKELPGVIDSFSLEDIRDGYYDDVIYVIMDQSVKFYPLQRKLSHDFNSISIYCGNIYIPAYVFESIVSSKISLIRPVLDDDILRAISCYNVYIMTEKSCSFELLGCRIFKLDFVLEDEVIPVMPRNAYDINLIIHSNNDITMSNNAVIEKLSISGTNHVHLENLHSLLVVTSKCTLSLDWNTLNNLRELSLVNNISCVISKCNDIIYLTPKQIGEPFYSELVNMESLVCTLSNQKQYLLFPNLKKLTMSRLIQSEYIPSKLEKYYITASRIPTHDFDKVKALQQRLLEMKSIKRMPLLLIAGTLSDIPFSDRFNVYYDIYIIDNRGFIINYCNIIFKLQWNHEELQNALLCNDRYIRRNRTLLSYFE